MLSAFDVFWYGIKSPRNVLRDVHVILGTQGKQSSNQLYLPQAPRNICSEPERELVASYQSGSSPTLQASVTTETPVCLLFCRSPRDNSSDFVVRQSNLFWSTPAATVFFFSIFGSLFAMKRGVTAASTKFHVVASYLRLAGVPSRESRTRQIYARAPLVDSVFTPRTPLGQISYWNLRPFALQRQTQGKCVSYKCLLCQEVLRDETGPPFNLEALKSFAAAQLMEENIEFWVEVRKPSRLTSHELA